MSRCGQNQIDRIGDVVAEKQPALPTRDSVADIKDRQAGHDGTFRLDMSKRLEIEKAGAA